MHSACRSRAPRRRPSKGICSCSACRGGCATSSVVDASSSTSTCGSDAAIFALNQVFATFGGPPRIESAGLAAAGSFHVATGGTNEDTARTKKPQLERHVSCHQREPVKI